MTTEKEVQLLNRVEKLQEALKLAIAMRDKQKSYFKTRTKGDLEESKRLESLFDKTAEEALAEYKQGDLFNS